MEIQETISEESPTSDWRPAGRPSSRYSTVARALSTEIDAGRYAVGSCIPTENELQKRFDVSRNTVRQALRELKEQGILAAHPGIGTVVRSKPGAPRLVQGVTSVAELLQFVEATRMQAMAQREIVADDGMAALLGCSPGQHWFEVTVLRTLAGLAEPLAQVLVYLRPEHADVIAHIDASTQPIFTMIESRHGTCVAEVSQEITPVALTRQSAQLLQAAPGCPALQIVRRYFDAQDRIILVSVGLYPGDRFSHSTRFRVQREARV